MFEDEEDVRANDNTDVNPFISIHEEADTRVEIHCLNIKARTFIIHAIDIDIRKELLAHYHQHLQAKQVFDAMKDGDFLNVGAMARYLGPEVCYALLLAHALSGCDSVSYMYGIGKPTVQKLY